MAGALVHHPQHGSKAAIPHPPPASVSLLLHYSNRLKHIGCVVFMFAGSLRVQVGGDWAGPVGPNTIFPTRHIVDYVKVAVSL
jgi:hypothetical protein